MGIIRTLLAISVVCTHTIGYVFVGGALAVRLFYIISGFLISYILVEARSYNSHRAFYANRMLRLFPLYYIAALMTFFLYSISCYLGKNVAFFDVYRHLDFHGILALVVSNITVFGQDWIMFTGVREGTFQLVGNFNKSDIAVWNGLLVPQAWTLGVELTFYLIAPFIIRHKWRIVLLLLGSLAVRAFTVIKGFGLDDPWNYRFFPSELSFFLIGALSHQLLRPFYRMVFRKHLPTISTAATVFLLFYCVIFFSIPHKTLNTILMIACFIILLPLLFEFQRLSPLDRRIGDLSYPIYILHVFVIGVVDLLIEPNEACWNCQLVRTIIVILSTIALSYASERFLLDRIEIIRTLIRGRRQPTKSPILDRLAENDVTI